MLQEATYHQPTCQLWLSGEANPLLAWSKLKGWQNFQFTLSLQAEVGADPIQIQGSQAEFERLYHVVNDYTQYLLAHKVLTLNGHRPRPIQALLAPADNTASPQIALSHKSATTHELYFGNLIHTAGRESLTIGIAQLFDLGNVLAESWLALQPKPGLGQRSKLLWQQTPIWLQSTAVAVVVLGLASTLMPLLQPSGLLISQESSSNTLPAAPALPELPLPNALDSGAIPLPSESAPATKPSLTPLPPLPNIPQEPAGPIDLEPVAPLPAPAAVPVPSQPQASGQTATVIPGPTQRPSNSGIDTGLPADVITSPRAGAEALRPTPNNNAEASAPRSPAAIARSLTLGGASSQAIESVRAYFSQRWQPPTELTQALEYTLILNPDGSLQRALPLNRAAEIYLDRTPIPLANEPFVPATQASAAVQLRLVLEPSGRVQVFGQN